MREKERDTYTGGEYLFGIEILEDAVRGRVVRLDGLYNAPELATQPVRADVWEEVAHVGGLLLQESLHNVSRAGLL